MTATLLDGKSTAASIKEGLKNRIIESAKKYGKAPGLAFIIIGDNPASQMYVSLKDKTCKMLGMTSKTAAFPEDEDEATILEQIAAYNNDSDIHGILIQLPLPPRFHAQRLITAIAPEKDVDGFTPSRLGELALGREMLVTCTAAGIIRLLDTYKIDVAGKHCVIINHQVVVGRPLTELFLNRNATVTICHEHTKNLSEMTRQADILVSAVGKAGLITKDMVKPGCVVIDVGVSKKEGKTVGDVDFEAVKEIASAITPVPGGVGPMTVALLMENTYKAYLELH